MSLFSSAFIKLFGCLTPFFRQRETQQCASQELAEVEELPESEALNFTANHKKCSKKHSKRPKKHEKGKHLQTPARPIVLKPIKGKQPKLPDNSGDFNLPDALFQPLPPVKRPPVLLVKEPQEEFTLPGCPLPIHLAAPLLRPVPAPDELFSCRFSCPLSPIAVHKFVRPGCPLQVPPSKVLAVPPPCPVPAPDELLSSRLSLKRPLSPIPAAHEGTAPFCLAGHQSSGSLQSASSPDLMLVDIEDEESEFAETIQAFTKPERPQQARRLLAWEKEEEEYEDDKVLEDESWTSELIELQDLSESGDSLFCTTPLDGDESQLEVKVQKEPKNRRLSKLAQLTWTKKVKDWVQSNLQKEEEMREKDLPHHSYRKDPKLKHL